ncbi:6-phosphogluconolactonase, partial [Streptococcus thermophilus]
MKKILVKNQVEGGKVAFELLKESLAAGAQTFGLATGSSPIALYQEMVESDVDFSEFYSVNLDEYVGLSPEHEQSYHAFMKAQLFDAKPFKESFLPDGMAEDLEKAAKDYDDVLAHHVIDLQILGIGSNGHIGFNEPGTPF